MGFEWIIGHFIHEFIHNCDKSFHQRRGYVTLPSILPIFHPFFTHFWGLLFVFMLSPMIFADVDMHQKFCEMTPRSLQKQIRMNNKPRNLWLEQFDRVKVIFDIYFFWFSFKVATYLLTVCQLMNTSAFNLY